MASMNTLSATDKARALLAMKVAADQREEILAAPGATGSTILPLPVRTSSRAPKGWEPRVTFAADGRPDAIFSPALPADLDESAALTEALTILNAMVPQGYWARLDEMRLDEAGWHRKLDPETGTGTGDAYTGAVRRYKWKIEPEPTLDDRIASMSESEWATAVEAVNKRKYPKLKNITDTDAVDLVVPIGDLQAGQHDGDGVDGLLARMALYPLYVKAEVKRLAMQKVPVKRIIIPTLGDLIENIVGFYSNSVWLVELNRRDQAKVARRLIHRIIEEVATLGLPILVPVAPGNHGEVRNGKGKMITDPADNEDIAIMEIVAELCQANPALKDQVKFHFTEGNKLDVTLDLGWGYTVGFAHGHTGANGGGAGSAAKQQNYLAKQALANTSLAGITYYVTGHYHSAMYVTLPGGRTWIQIPATCDSSEHFTDFFGLSGGPGLLTWTFGPDGLDNWRHHKLPTLLDLVDIPAAS